MILTIYFTSIRTSRRPFTEPIWCTPQRNAPTRKGAGAFLCDESDCVEGAQDVCGEVVGVLKADRESHDAG